MLCTIGCISDNPVSGVSALRAVWWWRRSPNYNNNENFCNTNTDGSNNNNNASWSAGVVAGFCAAGSNGVARVKDDPRKRRDTSLGENP